MGMSIGKYDKKEICVRERAFSNETGNNVFRVITTTRFFVLLVSFSHSVYHESRLYNL